METIITLIFGTIAITGCIGIIGLENARIRKHYGENIKNFKLYR